eukprot:1863622-Rhodomonas_salina.2
MRSTCLRRSAAACTRSQLCRTRLLLLEACDGPSACVWHDASALLEESTCGAHCGSEVSTRGQSCIARAIQQRRGKGEGRGGDGGGSRGSTARRRLRRGKRGGGERHGRRMREGEEEE